MSIFYTRMALFHHVGIVQAFWDIHKRPDLTNLRTRKTTIISWVVCYSLFFCHDDNWLPQCEVEGFCDGTSIDAPPVETESGCQRACYDTIDCNWYSFFQSLNRCFLGSDCLLWKAVIMIAHMVEKIAICKVILSLIQHTAYPGNLPRLVQKLWLSVTSSLGIKKVLACSRKLAFTCLTRNRHRVGEEQLILWPLPPIPCAYQIDLLAMVVNSKCVMLVQRKHNIMQKHCSATTWASCIVLLACHPLLGLSRPTFSTLEAWTSLTKHEGCICRACSKIFCQKKRYLSRIFIFDQRVDMKR